ncbi:hypothetical protein FZEAL_9231 [Fusarium zealandicum]|uniref:Mid2 domain-containing protein n=1 Tax=Fusarium zealandicum TaxID=1053134 RepID=A0A8H4UCQ9_9HYPO|nr:hypothetical protein FZEAL_9231 [Fusarium zealandicum]
MHLSLQLGLVILAAANVRSETRFLRPSGPGPTKDYSENPKRELGGDWDLIWEKDFDRADILVVQDIAGTENEYSAKVLSEQAVVWIAPWKLTTTDIANTASTKYTWRVSFDGFTKGHDPTVSNVYYFAMSENGVPVPYYTSHYFNITDPDKASSSTVTGAASSTTTGGGASSTAAEGSSTTSSSDTAEKKDDGGLSTGATAGIAVGAAIGGLLICGGLGFLLWKRFRKGDHATPGSTDHDKEVVASTTMQGYPQYQQYQQYQQHPFYQPVQQQQQPYAANTGGLHEAP